MQAARHYRNRPRHSQLRIRSGCKPMDTFASRSEFNSDCKANQQRQRRPNLREPLQRGQKLWPDDARLAEQPQLPGLRPQARRIDKRHAQQHHASRQLDHQRQRQHHVDCRQRRACRHRQQCQRRSGQAAHPARRAGLFKRRAEQRRDDQPGQAKRHQHPRRHRQAQRRHLVAWRRQGHGEQHQSGGDNAFGRQHRYTGHWHAGQERRRLARSKRYLLSWRQAEHTR